MFASLSRLWQSSPRRRVATARPWGNRVETLENLALLSASALHAHHAKECPPPADVSVEGKVANTKAPPVDFNKTWNLQGTLDGQQTTGTAAITQNGSSAHVVLNFSGFPQFTNFELDGTIKGRKLTAIFHGSQNGVADAKYTQKVKPNGDYSWKLFWNDVQGT